MKSIATRRYLVINTLFQHNASLKLYLAMLEHNNGKNSDVNKDFLSFWY